MTSPRASRDSRRLPGPRGREGESPRLAREPHPAIGKEETVSSLSDAEVIGRSLDQPEAFGLIYDRHAPSLLRFLGPDRVRAAQDVRRVAHERAAVAVRDGLESLVEAPARRGPAAARERPDGGRRGNGQARERQGPRCPLALPARGRRDRGAAGRRARGAPALRMGGTLVPRRSRGSRAANRHGTLAGSTAPARACANCSTRTGKTGCDRGATCCTRCDLERPRSTTPTERVSSPVASEPSRYTATSCGPSVPRTPGSSSASRASTSA